MDSILYKKNRKEKFYFFFHSFDLVLVTYNRLIRRKNSILNDISRFLILRHLIAGD
jgi:hypothetical protein